MPNTRSVYGVSTKHNKIFKILETLVHSKEPDYKHARMVACVVYKNNIVSFGFNRKKTHPLQAQFGKNKDCIYLHAEIDAIIRSLRVISVEQLSQSSLYIMRIKKGTSQHWQWGLAKPCKGCQKAIAEFDIKHVFYTENSNSAMFNYLF